MAEEQQAAPTDGSLPGSAGMGHPRFDFPPDEWFSTSLHPRIRDGLRTAYRVYDMNPGNLRIAYVAKRISRGAPWVRSEAFEALLTTFIIDAQRKAEEQDLESQTISVDNPLLAADDGTSLQGAINPVYSPEASRPSSAWQPSPDFCVWGGRSKHAGNTEGGP